MLIRDQAYEAVKNLTEEEQREFAACVLTIATEGLHSPPAANHIMDFMETIKVYCEGCRRELVWSSYGWDVYVEECERCRDKDEDYAREEGYQDGHDAGYEDGYATGSREGYAEAEGEYEEKLEDLQNKLDDLTEEVAELTKKVEEKENE